MLDGRGRVRITDFGLRSRRMQGTRSALSGTPAYMAPEQLAGRGASVRSDIYALGLVLLRALHRQTRLRSRFLRRPRVRKAEEMPPTPSELIKDMDPAVERVILRATARDPAARPASVAQVAAALPGGNALEAMLRAGETPSPEMVAASRSGEGLMRAWRGPSSRSS